METDNKFLEKLESYIRERPHFCLFIISILSFSLIFLQLLNIEDLLGISSIFFLNGPLQMVFILSTIFTVLFLPTYPLFFIILSKTDLRKLEKLSITIVCNLSFYVLSGYIGDALGVLLSGLYFYLITVIFYFSLILYIIRKESKDNTYVFLKFIEKTNTEDKDSEEDLSLYTKLRKSLPFNGMLLIIFLLLFCILNIVRYSFFFGTDAWLHTLIIKKITTSGILPYEDYHGTLSLHIFSAVIYFFSGVDYLLIPRFYVFYPVFLAALILYNLFMRIFRRKNIAFFGVFLMIAAPIGFGYTMYQFWPSGLATVLSVFIFFMLYVRLQSLIQLERPTKKTTYSGSIYYYAIIVTVFITANLTHVLTVFVFVVAMFWIYFIYFLRDIRRGFDFVLICGLGGIFILLGLFGIGTGHYWFVSSPNFPWYYIVGGLVGVVFVGYFLVTRLRSSIIFIKGRYSVTITGESKAYYKKFEDKLLYPIAFGFAILFAVLFVIANTLLFNLDISTIFVGFDVLIISLFAVWGLITFQKKPRGKIFFIWVLFFGFLLGAFFGYSYVFGGETPLVFRLYILCVPVIVIGFLAFVYKQVKLNAIIEKKIKIFIVFIIIFSLGANNYYEFTIVNEFHIKRQEAHSVEWLADHTDDEKVIASEYGWSFIIMYYDYPYEEKGDAPNIYDTHTYWFYQDDLMPPDNHEYKNGTNRLHQIKDREDTDVYIVLADYYQMNTDDQPYNELSEDEVEEYYEKDYLNRVYSSRNEKGKDLPIYWVI